MNKGYEFTMKRTYILNSDEELKDLTSAFERIVADGWFKDLQLMTITPMFPYGEGYEVKIEIIVYDTTWLERNEFFDYVKNLMETFERMETKFDI